MGNYTTEQHAEQIAESIVNGQHKQAIKQWKVAMNKDCRAFALCEEMNGLGIDTFAIVKLLCSIVEGN
jgi:hypothetical protein